MFKASEFKFPAIFLPSFFLFKAKVCKYLELLKSSTSRFFRSITKKFLQKKAKTKQELKSSKLRNFREQMKVFNFLLHCSHLNFSSRHLILSGRIWEFETLGIFSSVEIKIFIFFLFNFFSLINLKKIMVFITILDTKNSELGVIKTRYSQDHVEGF